jgi:hypothetical protein
MTLSATMACDWPGQGALPEVGRILAVLAKKLESQTIQRDREGRLFDGNGNAVGKWDYTA